MFYYHYLKRIVSHSYCKSFICVISIYQYFLLKNKSGSTLRRFCHGCCSHPSPLCCSSPALLCTHTPVRHTHTCAAALIAPHLPRICNQAAACEAAALLRLGSRALSFLPPVPVCYWCVDLVDFGLFPWTWPALLSCPGKADLVPPVWCLVFPSACWGCFWVSLWVLTHFEVPSCGANSFETAGW